MKKLLTISLLLCLVLLFGCNDSTAPADNAEITEENYNLGIRTLEANDDEAEFVSKLLEDYCIYEFDAPEDITEIKVFMEKTKADEVIESEVLNTINLDSHGGPKSGTIALLKVGKDTYNLCIEEYKNEEGSMLSTYRTYDIELTEVPDGYTTTSVTGAIDISNQEIEAGKTYPIYKISFGSEDGSLAKVTNTVYIVFE